MQRVPARAPAGRRLAHARATTTAQSLDRLLDEHLDGRHNHEKTALDALEPRNLAPDLPPRPEAASSRWQLNRLRCMTPAEIGAPRAARRAGARRAAGAWSACARCPSRDLAFVPSAWIHRTSARRPRAVRRGRRAHRRGLARRVRAARTSTSARRRAGTAIPRPASRRRSPSASCSTTATPTSSATQVSVGAEPPPAPGDARAGLCSHPARRNTSTRCGSTSTAGSSPARTAWAPNWSSSLEAALRLDQLVARRGS